MGFLLTFTAFLILLVSLGIQAQFLFPLPQPGAFAGFGPHAPPELNGAMQERAQAKAQAQAQVQGQSLETSSTPSPLPSDPSGGGEGMGTHVDPVVVASHMNGYDPQPIASPYGTDPLSQCSTIGGSEDLRVLHSYDDSSTIAFKPPPVFLLPGFASTRMNSWMPKKCVGNMGFNVGDRVWLDTAKVVAYGACWLECMMLSPYNMTDLKDGCKLRPVQGTEAIGELDPGLITGRMTSIWQLIIRRLSESFNYDPFGIMAAPYDFRVPPPILDSRDNYFYRLMTSIETAVKSQRKYKRTHSAASSEIVCDQGVIIIAHSMGNNMFRYFLEWLKHEKGKFHYQEWIDDHIAAYFAVGAPLIGSLESLKAMITGLTFGLPISIADARKMGTTFGSTAWMYPYSPKFKTITPTSSYEWPTYSLKLKFPLTSSKNESQLDAEDKETIHRLAGKAKEYHPKKLSQMWRDLKAFDEVGDRSIFWEKNFYHNDPIIDHSLAWERPPIKKVYCVYGVNMKTELGQSYQATISPKPGSPGENDITWTTSDIVYEEGGRIYSEGGDPSVESFVPGRKSGDLTVPYVSLSLCHQWLGGHVNVTKIPQRVYFSDELKTRTGNEPSITFYESSSQKVKGILGEELEVETAVWEIDNADHRGVIQSESFLRELKEEFHFYGQLQYEKERKMKDGTSHGRLEAPHFASKQARIPRSDEDCVWDYLAARCKYSEYCEYNYHFGDLTLDNSCRLRQTHTTSSSSTSSSSSSATSRQQSGSGGNKPITTAPCQCKSSCVSGFCEYVDNCNRATQPFGPNNGWWGPCEATPTRKFDVEAAAKVP